MKTLLLTISLLAFCRAARAEEHPDDGEPFGTIDEADIDRLAALAKAAGFDLMPEMEKVYKQDEKALEGFFKLSLSFNSLDRNARTYGQIVYSCVLNMGGAVGLNVFFHVLDRQSPEVRQRVRDFLYYPAPRYPEDQRKEQEAETRQDLPRLFPREYQFGNDDPIFAEPAKGKPASNE